MIQYPLTFDVHAKSSSGIQTTWTAQAMDYKVPVAIPPEFQGPGGGMSPEDLYALALTNCFIATFKVFAEKSRLSFNDVGVKARLEVDRNEKGHPWMARVHLKVHLTGVQQQEAAQRILDKTAQGCMILNSVNTQKTFEFEISP